MLATEKKPPLPEFDRHVFEIVVPKDHYLRQVAERIDFEQFRPRLVGAYCLDMGRPAIDPVLMLKIMFLCFHYKLSDRQVMKRTETDVAFRWFLDLGLNETVPNHTDGTKFRNRIGERRFKQVFQDLVAQARELGLVKDRLRLKDATHMFADVADVQPLQLAAQVRDRLLQMADPFFPDWVNEQQVRIETLRQTTAEFPDDERLAARIEHLRQMAAELRERVASLSPPWAADQTKRQRLDKMLAVTAKLLADSDDPKVKDRLASGIDPDARVGKHGRFYVGYMLDLAIDADSEIITAVNVLPGNGAEAADAIELIRQEETAQGNDVDGISMDGAGFNGPVLRELTDPDGLNLDVTVPPPTPTERKTFGPERFALTVLDDGSAELTCPNGQSTQQRERNEKETGWKYIFKPSQCANCPLREQCLQNPQSQGGRTVIKNDYEAEYRKVEEKAKTPEYQETRRTHPKIERKLGEVARHQGARRARYRGLPKVLAQAILTTLVVNVKLIVKLLAQKTSEAASALPVRAELGTP
jgi:transposase